MMMMLKRAQSCVIMKMLKKILGLSNDDNAPEELGIVGFDRYQALYNCDVNKRANCRAFSVLP
jgi:hypothetical protein